MHAEQLRTLQAENTRLQELVHHLRHEMIESSDLGDEGDAEELSQQVFTSSAFQTALQGNADMKALWQDQEMYLEKANRGKNAIKGMRWHPRYVHILLQYIHEEGMYDSKQGL